MGEGIAVHGGAGHRGCHQPRPQPLPKVCPGVHAEGPRLPARSALRKVLRDTLKHSKAALVSGPVLHPFNGIAQRGQTVTASCCLLNVHPLRHRPHRSTCSPGSAQKNFSGTFRWVMC